MGHYERVSIDAICKKSELAEIAEGINSGKIKWPLNIRVDRFYYRKPLIEYEYKVTPTPVDHGYLEKLSSLFPLVSFSRNSEYEDPDAEEDCFDWYCCGRKCQSVEIDDLIEQERNRSARRFMKAGSIHSRGLYHELSRQLDGSVISNGKNMFGECDTQEWTGIHAVACGDWHSVGLKEDGTLISCGSNANRQCNVSNLRNSVHQISCGRYHTAILYKDGTIDVRGKLEHLIEDRFLEKNVNITGATYPVFRSVEGSSSKKRNRRIEDTSVGDFLELRIDEDNPSYYPVGIEILNRNGESLGYLEDDNTMPITMIARDITKLKAYAESVTPLSKQYPGARYALLTVRIEESSQINSDMPQYHQIPYSSWHDIVEMCSVHDAVVGKDFHGEIFVDGDPGCSVHEMNSFLNNRFRK